MRLRVFVFCFATRMRTCASRCSCVCNFLSASCTDPDVCVRTGEYVNVRQPMLHASTDTIKPSQPQCHSTHMTQLFRVRLRASACACTCFTFPDCLHVAN
eukprot:GDKI01014992.1.p1 GENE.GDKI01014992.1~~GDKI01014992.1.p1  ORF type:complete len:100 (+),score=17.39 GDKI01014992.1:240-539(+)